jgi:hypothetical protein
VDRLHVIPEGLDQAIRRKCGESEGCSTESSRSTCVRWVLAKLVPTHRCLASYTVEPCHSTSGGTDPRRLNDGGGRMSWDVIRPSLNVSWGPFSRSSSAPER